jgi:TonB family protein
VLVEMRLEGDGNLTGVRLLEGSGYAVLDDATIVAVRRAAPFPPVARVLTVPVEYRLMP